MVAYITELTPENSKEFIESEGLVLIDIWAAWCGPCKVISPIVDEISSIYKDTLKVGKLDADKNSEFVRELNVRSIPTLVFYKDGVELERSVGAITKQKLTEMIDKHLSVVSQ